MTGKNKADQKASPNNTRTKYNPHLDQLKAAICEELAGLRNPIRFDVMQDRYRCNGFTRTEIIAAVNELVAAGALEYVRQPMRAESRRLPGICIWLRAVGSEVQQ